MATTKTDGKIESAFALWNGRGKVAYSGFVKEEVVIPAGAKVICFVNDNATPENKRPHLSVCYVIENENGE